MYLVVHRNINTTYLLNRVRIQPFIQLICELRWRQFSADPLSAERAWMRKQRLRQIRPIQSQQHQTNERVPAFRIALRHRVTTKSLCGALRKTRDAESSPDTHDSL